MVFLPGLNAGRGFLPLHVSCGFLPSSSQLNVELNRLASQLHVLLARRTLRDEIEHLNNVYADTPVTLDRTDPDQDADAARILLALVQGYIWEQPASPASRVPAVLAKNSYAIAKRRQRFPILTYYDYILTNWRLTDVALGMRLKTFSRWYHSQVLRMKPGLSSFMS